ncbi:MULTISPECIES: hypothetical protein [unclassified Mesorhizobium]|uniref:hypothetical protein n=1 Tax=unclassified Mesorhizobium TaxID=325217 RepID=UPI0019264CC0|nr:MULTISPECIES: hypothetical protein [unclassified Mesorhizobium]BCH23791.1 hypothetical protein MesoLjLb_35760 [Mesorhizobium sp. L-8-3]
MPNRRDMLAACMVVLASASFASQAFATGFSWDGTWSGKAANGRTTVIKISNGKVVSWTSNGSAANIKSSSVTSTKVMIQHAEGARVTLRPRDDGTVSYKWQGNNASSTAILKRR